MLRHRHDDDFSGYGKVMNAVNPSREALHHREGVRVEIPRKIRRSCKGAARNVMDNSCTEKMLTHSRI